MPSRAEASSIGRGASRAAFSAVVGDARGGFGLRDGRGHLGEAGGEAIALRDRRLVPDRRPIDLLGVSGQRGVMRSQRRQRRLGALTGFIERAHRLRERLAQRVGDHDDLAPALGGRIPLRGELESRASLPGARAHGVRRVHLARPGDDRDAVAGHGTCERRSGGIDGGEVVRDDDVRQDAEHAVRRGDDVDRSDDAGHRGSDRARGGTPPARSRCRRCRDPRRAPPRRPRARPVGCPRARPRRADRGPPRSRPRSPARP